MDDVKQERKERLASLQSQKTDLCQSKMILQSELSSLNSEIRGNRVPADEYKRISRRQSSLRQEINQLDRQVVGLNDEIRTETYSNIHPDPDNEKKKSDVQKLVELRYEYESFAADPTRVASMRRMASEFTMRLTRIIRDM